MIATATQPSGLDAGVDQRPREALTRLLDDLASVLMQTPSSAYTARPLPGVSGSIGQHVRHILDHVTAVVTANESAVLTYDRRQRGTSVETDSAAAIRSIWRINAILNGASVEALDRPVTVAMMLERGGEPALMQSTRRRELAFVIGHTIHHQALIAMLLAIAGVHVPESFGLAPTTPKLVS
jgi:uncharacterized damage-inducible protein DinB